MQTSINFEPIGERILVLRDRAADRSPDGKIIIPESAQEPPVEGTVIALGTAYDGERAKDCWLQIGDRVSFTQYTGIRVPDVGAKEDDYLVMRPDEILGRRKVSGKPKASKAA